jgi:hypothetical protein
MPTTDSSTSSPQGGDVTLGNIKNAIPDICYALRPMTLALELSNFCSRFALPASAWRTISRSWWRLRLGPHRYPAG